MVLDTVTTAAHFIDVFLYVYIVVIILWALTSMIRLPYSLTPVQRFLHDVSEPIVRPFRRVLPMFGPIDLSPMAAILALGALRVVIGTLLNRLH
jgi:YggT family protein